MKARKKRTQTKRTKPCVYTPKFIISQTRETLSSEEISFSDEEEVPIDSEDDSLNATAKHLNFEDELNSLARQQRRFGPIFVYE